MKRVNENDNQEGSQGAAQGDARSDREPLTVDAQLYLPLHTALCSQDRL